MYIMMEQIKIILHSILNIGNTMSAFVYPIFNGIKDAGLTDNIIRRTKKYSKNISKRLKRTRRRSSTQKTTLRKTYKKRNS